ncbi:MAG TPA: hypothetical protein VFE98_10960 [Candidatus Bathyarchaeia archaeon]|nr:hypothetical protein [Candidatus Bathyarchaeia archaeon]
MIIPFSSFATNLEVEGTCNKFARAGFKVERPLAQGTQGFCKVTLDADRQLRLQIYGTRRVLIYAHGPEDEATAKKLLKRYAVTVDNAPLSFEDYKVYPDKKQAAEDLMALCQILLVDNLNLEVALGLLARDLSDGSDRRVMTEYAKSLHDLTRTLFRLRQQDPLAPISPAVIESLDPQNKRADWIRTNSLPVPTGAFTQALRTAAATLRDLSQDPTGVSEQLRTQPVHDFTGVFRRDALQSFQKLAKHSVAEG